MLKGYDSKDIIFIVADSKNDSVSKFSLLTKEYFDKNKITKPNDITLGNSGKGTEFVVSENGGIKNENINIGKIKKGDFRKSKEKIKKLNAQKKKLELQIEKEKHNELCSVLSDYGIKSVNDFQDFLEKYTSEASADENANGEN